MISSDNFCANILYGGGVQFFSAARIAVEPKTLSAVINTIFAKAFMIFSLDKEG